jgi:hypothetical protein
VLLESPSAWASAIASPSVASVLKGVALATSFAAWPAPSGPTWRTEPRLESNGSACSTSATGPPTKIVSEPASALPRLPNTGASSRGVPAGKTDARRATPAGPTVDISITVSVASAPAAMLSSPSLTARSAAGSETIVIRTSARRAASAGLPAAVAPRSMICASLAGVRFQTMISWPAESNRCAIRLPIAPSPTTAIALISRPLSRP